MALSDRLKKSNFQQFATAKLAKVANDNPKESEPQTNDRLVKCGNCASWQPLHQHRKGGGFCANGIYPLALVHWSETLKNCDKWRRESER
jgi:hypothetical protein